MKYDNFEKDIKLQLQELEVNPPDTVWDMLDQKMPSPSSGLIRTKLYLGGLIATSLVVLTAAVLYLESDNQNPTQKENILYNDTTLMVNNVALRAPNLVIDSVLPGYSPRIGVYATKEGIRIIPTPPAPIRDWLEEGRYLMLYFYNDDCRYCTRLEQESLGEESVKALIDESFKIVSLDVRDPKNAELKKRYEVTASPTLLFFNEAGQPYYRVQGFRSADAMTDILDAVLSDRKIPEKINLAKIIAFPEIEATERPRTFKILPNPNRGQFQVEAHNAEKIAAHIQVLSIGGQLITDRKTGAVQGSWKQSFDLSHLEKGYYVIRIQRGEEVLVEKMLIQ